MTRPTVDVRRAGVADVEDLIMLWTLAREELNRSGRAPGLGSALPDQFRGRIEQAIRREELHVAIARWGGQPVGYALMRLSCPTPLVENIALYLEHLFVQPEYRRHGVARALLATVAATAERHGAEQIVASAPPSARDTHRYLARLGFSPMVVRRVAPTAVLRRRLSGESRRGGLEDLLSRRRSLRARTTWAGLRGEPVASPADAVLDEPEVRRVAAVQDPAGGEDLAACAERLVPAAAAVGVNSVGVNRSVSTRSVSTRSVSTRSVSTRSVPTGSGSTRPRTPSRCRCPPR